MAAQTQAKKDPNVYHEEESEEEAQLKKEEQTLDEERPQLGPLAALTSFVTLSKVNSARTKRDALKHLSSSEGVKKLLCDHKNPHGVAHVEEEINIASELFKKGVFKKEPEKVTRRFLFRKSNLTATQLKKTKQALEVAKTAKTEVDNRIFELRLEAYIRRYGLEGEELTRFRANLDAWQKNNPGKSLDDGLVVEASRITRSRDVKFKPQDERLALQKEYDKVWKEDVVALKDEKIKGVVQKNKAVIEEILDANSPLLTLEELARKKEYVKTGQQPPLLEADQQVETQTKVVKIQSKRRKFSLPITPIRSRLSNRLQIARNIIAQIQNQIINIARQIYERIIKAIIHRIMLAVKKAVAKLISKAVFKAVGRIIGQAISSIVPVVGNIIMGIAQILGIDTLVFKALKFVFFIFIGVTIFGFLLFFLGPASGLSNFNTSIFQNPLILNVLGEGDQNWNEFAQTHLESFGSNEPLLEIKEDSKNNRWASFENEFLKDKKTPISLNLPK